MAKNLPLEEPTGVEPGEVDNRLSLIPDEFPAIRDWEDGEEYSLADIGEGVKLRQISPGEFEVLPPATETAEESEEAEAPRSMRDGGMMKAKGPVARMMMEE